MLTRVTIVYSRYYSISLMFNEADDTAYLHKEYKDIDDEWVDLVRHLPDNKVNALRTLLRLSDGGPAIAVILQDELLELELLELELLG